MRRLQGASDCFLEHRQGVLIIPTAPGFHLRIASRFSVVSAVDGWIAMRVPFSRLG